MENNEKVREELRVLKGKLADCETDIRNVASLVEQEALDTLWAVAHFHD